MRGTWIDRLPLRQEAMIVPVHLRVPALRPGLEIRVALETRVISQRVQGDRRVMISSAQKGGQVLRALAQSDRPTEGPAPAVAFYARRSFAGVECRESRRIRLNGLLVVRLLRLGVARRAKGILVLERQGKACPSDAQHHDTEACGNCAEEP